MLYGQWKSLFLWIFFSASTPAVHRSGSAVGGWLIAVVGPGSYLMSEILLFIFSFPAQRRGEEVHSSLMSGHHGNGKLTSNAMWQRLGRKSQPTQPNTPFLFIMIYEPSSPFLLLSIPSLTCSTRPSLLHYWLLQFVGSTFHSFLSICTQRKRIGRSSCNDEPTADICSSSDCCPWRRWACQSLQNLERQQCKIHSQLSPSSSCISLDDL